MKRRKKRMNRKRAIVEGSHGTHKRIFLIRGGRVVRERDVDMYLKYGWSNMTALGHWDSKFHFK